MTSNLDRVNMMYNNQEVTVASKCHLETFFDFDFFLYCFDEEYYTFVGRYWVLHVYISWDSFYLIPIPATFTRRPNKHKHVSLFSKQFDSLFSSRIDSLSSIERGNTKNNIWSLQLI